LRFFFRCFFFGNFGGGHIENLCPKTKEEKRRKKRKKHLTVGELDVRAFRDDNAQKKKEKKRKK